METPPAGFVDDPTIADQDELWRRIHPSQVVPDGNSGRLRISSGAFFDSSDGTPMSVCLGREDTPDRVLAAHRGDLLAALLAREVRDLAQGVHRAPTVEDPSHAFVFGKKTDGVRRKLAAASARWVVGPAA